MVFSQATLERSCPCASLIIEVKNEVSEIFFWPRSDLAGDQDGAVS